MKCDDVKAALAVEANASIAEHSQRFFKTGQGDYGEGDVFIGVRVPVLRKYAKQFKTLPLQEVINLLHSTIHEERLLALLILVLQFEKADEKLRKRIYTKYLANTRFINNWDLVDASAHQVVGGYLINKDRSPLFELASSTLLWDRRIAIIATLHFIKQHDLAVTFELAEQLLDDSEDLIHKAVGWMLREAGKRDRLKLELFLAKYCRLMPRTMLRYAIEKFSKSERQRYLKGEIVGSQ